LNFGSAYVWTLMKKQNHQRSDEAHTANKRFLFAIHHQSGLKIL
jgi:hypothetical protein